MVNRQAMMLLHRTYIEDFTRLAALQAGDEKPPKMSHGEFHAKHGTVHKMSKRMMKMKSMRVPDQMVSAAAILAASKSGELMAETELGAILADNAINLTEDLMEGVNDARLQAQRSTEEAAKRIAKQVDRVFSPGKRSNAVAPEKSEEELETAELSANRTAVQQVYAAMNVDEVCAP
jgi:hypothetical protein